MTRDEQEQICRTIAVSCMWGQGGIASVILDGLDRKGPKIDSTWREVYRSVEKDARRQSVGVITDEKELDLYLRDRYWLVNYDEDGCSLFNPPPMNGLAKYVSKELADKHKQRQEKMRKMMEGVRPYSGLGGVGGFLG
jgi:hypothetical protein